MILVTGASGFIGSRLAEALVREYGREHVVALSSKNLQTCSCLLHRDYHFDKDYFISSGYETITTIVHAGAYTPKNAGQANDWASCNKNIITTDALLSAHFPQLERVIYLSTLDVYQNAELTTEETPTVPVSLYGQSKLYCEKMVLSWASENKKTAQVLRIGHVYGPGEEAYQKVIPVSMKKLIRDQPLQLWGSGDEFRSFIYIDDVISAIQKAVHLKENAGPVNIVSGNKITVLQLIQKLIRLTGRDHVEVEKIETKVPARNLVFNNERMRTWLLSEETDLDEGLRREWEYMRGLEV
jgi:UDP-glucose 4-epimerase